MNLIVTAYTIYIPVMIALTIWVGNSIHRNSNTFLLEIFPDHEKVAAAVNNLLQIVFYLVSFGFGFLCLRIYLPGYYTEQAHAAFMTTNKELVEQLATKLGGFTLFVGFLLFFDLLIMLGLRKGARNVKVREEQMRMYNQMHQAQAAQARK
jgi:uncharacterized BrkB/YihY/UPF0761 family membrane protein